VSLAADSAATLSLQNESKVFHSLNKIFRLSLVHPVGIMIYGDATLMNVQWETIIKLYRQRLQCRNYPTLNGYVKDFFDFLVSQKYDFFPPEAQEKYIEFTSAGIINDIRGCVDSKIQEESKKKELTDIQIKNNVSLVIDGFKEKTENLPDASNAITKGEVKKIYGKIINDVATDIFKNLKPFKKDINKIIDLVANYFTKDHDDNAYSGVVFAGFGEKDIYPKMVAHKIEGVINNKLSCSFDRETVISAQNPGSIHKFALGDTIATFIEGIDPKQSSIINDYIREILEKCPRSVMSMLDEELSLNNTQKQKIFQKITALSNNCYQNFINDIQQYRGEHHVLPLINMVALLPKEELAIMAETLVNLTSFKQRLSMSAETVGGPIDVAIISKGDGFLWVKRKPSFDKQINTYL
ncbi:MAG: hypothetical protein KAS94_01175, partial [Desulfobulbaceae bacterium]|nr:hypothetical protein [Desulfobulbaceae bacterium]